MSPHRRFAILLALALGLVAPAARGGDIVVNFNDLTYSNAIRSEFKLPFRPGTCKRKL